MTDKPSSTDRWRASDWIDVDSSERSPVESDEPAAPSPVALSHDGVTWHVDGDACPYHRGNDGPTVEVAASAVDRLWAVHLAVDADAVDCDDVAHGITIDDDTIWLHLCRDCIPVLQSETTTDINTMTPVSWPASRPDSWEPGLFTPSNRLPYKIPEERGDLLHSPDGETVEPIVVEEGDERQWAAARASLRPYITYEEDDAVAQIRLSLAPVFCQFTTEALRQLRGLSARLNRERPQASEHPVSTPSILVDMDSVWTDLGLPGEAVVLQVPRGCGWPLLDGLVAFTADVSNWTRYGSPVSGVDDQLYPEVLPAAAPHPEAPPVTVAEDGIEQRVAVDAVPSSFESVPVVKTAALTGSITTREEFKPVEPLAVGDSCPACGAEITELVTVETELEHRTDGSHCLVPASEVHGHDDAESLLVVHSEDGE